MYPQGHILQEIVDQTGLSINDFANKLNILMEYLKNLGLQDLAKLKANFPAI